MMPAKEKAKHLIEDFTFCIFNPDNPQEYSLKPFAKQCAILCVDEKLKTLAELLPYGMNYLQKRDELLEVIQEIENL